jgi:hypothetical protein
LSKPLPLKNKEMAGTIAKLIAEGDKPFAIINRKSKHETLTLTYLVMQKHTMLLMVEELGMQD